MPAEVCLNCGNSIRLADRVCSRCNLDCGYPNVRFAARDEEVQALEERVRQAQAAAAARHTTQALQRLEDALGRTKAIMNRQLSVLHSWVRSNNPIFANFYHEVEAGRQPIDDRYNRQRSSAENTVNPEFYRELSIAALSLDEVGISYYGPYTVTLATQLISHRATVFEENPFYFNERHGVISGHEPPFGFRATWDDRVKLGVAKLHPRLRSDTHGDAALAAIIMPLDRDQAESDFIEVHIYGGLHREAVERILGPRPVDEVDQVFWDDVKARFEALGVRIEER